MFEHEGAVDGEGKAGDHIEDVEDEYEAHGPVDLTLDVQAELLIGCTCKSELG